MEPLKLQNVWYQIYKILETSLPMFPYDKSIMYYGGDRVINGVVFNNKIAKIAYID